MSKGVNKSSSDNPDTIWMDSPFYWHQECISKYTCFYLKSSHLSQASTKYCANFNCSTVFASSWCPIPSCWFKKDLVWNNTTYGKFNIGCSTLIKVDTGDSHSQGPSRFFIKHQQSHSHIYSIHSPGDAYSSITNTKINDVLGLLCAHSLAKLGLAPSGPKHPPKVHQKILHDSVAVSY